MDPTLAAVRTAHAGPNPAGLADGSRWSFRGPQGERPPVPSGRSVRIPEGCQSAGQVLAGVRSRRSGTPPGCVGMRRGCPVVVSPLAPNDHRLPSANPAGLTGLPRGGCGRLPERSNSRSPAAEPGAFLLDQKPFLPAARSPRQTPWRRDVLPHAAGKARSRKPSPSFLPARVRGVGKEWGESYGTCMELVWNSYGTAMEHIEGNPLAPRSYPAWKELAPHQRHRSSAGWRRRGPSTPVP